MKIDIYEERNKGIARLKKNFAEVFLTDEYRDFGTYKCTGCPLRSSCSDFSSENPGCALRKKLFDQNFGDVRTLDSDTIAYNKRTLLSKLHTELEILLRLDKGNISYRTIELAKVILSEYSKLYTDLRGRTVNITNDKTAPWREDEDVKEYLELIKAKKKKRKEPAE